MDNVGTSTNGSARDAATTLVTRWMALWNGDYAIAEQIISPDNRVHAAMFDGGDGSAVGGVSGMVDFVAMMRALGSDLTSRSRSGRSSMATTSWSGGSRPVHYDGGMPGAGAPVGTAVTFHGTDILRVADGQVVEYWLNGDTLDLMTQLQVGAG